jgi:hypothetical protein
VPRSSDPLRRKNRDFRIPLKEEPQPACSWGVFSHLGGYGGKRSEKLSPGDGILHLLKVKDRVTDECLLLKSEQRRPTPFYGRDALGPNAPPHCLFVDPKCPQKVAIDIMLPFVSVVVRYCGCPLV